MRRPARVVLGALLRAHLQIVGERAGPQRRAHMHVPGQRGRAAVAAELGGGEAIGAEATRRARHAPWGCRCASRPSGCMSRKFSIGKVASRSCCAARGASTRAPKRARLVDQRGFLVVRAGTRRARRSARRGRACRGRWFMPARLSGLRAQAHALRKLKIAASKAAGASRFGMWPSPGRQTVVRARDFAGHLLHHRRRRIAVVLGRRGTAPEP